MHYIDTHTHTHTHPHISKQRVSKRKRVFLCEGERKSVTFRNTRTPIAKSDEGKVSNANQHNRHALENLTA